MLIVPTPVGAEARDTVLSQSLSPDPLRVPHGMRLAPDLASADARLLQHVDPARDRARDEERFDVLYDAFNLERGLIDTLTDPGRGPSQRQDADTLLDRFDREADAIIGRLSFADNQSLAADMLSRGRDAVSRAVAQTRETDRLSRVEERLAATRAQLEAGRFNDPVERGGAIETLASMIDASGLPEGRRRALLGDVEALRAGRPAPVLPVGSPVPAAHPENIAETPGFEHNQAPSPSSRQGSYGPDLDASAQHLHELTADGGVALQGLPDHERSAVLNGALDTFFASSSGVDDRQIAASAVAAGLNPRRAVAVNALLDATPQDFQRVGQLLNEQFADRPGLRNYLIRQLKVIVGNPGNRAVRDAVQGELLGYLSPTLREPTIDPREARTAAEIEDIYRRVRDGSGVQADRERAAWELAELVLSVLPVSGEYLSARDAYYAGIAAFEAFEQGRTLDGLTSSLEALVHGAGAIPLLGYGARIGRGAARAAGWLYDRLSGALGRARIDAPTGVVSLSARSPTPTPDDNRRLRESREQTLLSDVNQVFDEESEGFYSLMERLVQDGLEPKFLDQGRYPNIIDHISEAREQGRPSLLTVYRPGISTNRSAAVRGLPPRGRDGLDRDEYPPAIAQEGGIRGSSRYIPAGENRGAGASLGNQLRGLEDGREFVIILTKNMPRKWMRNRKNRAR